MIKDIAIIFFSIFLETLPFLLLGSLISAIIEVFVSDDLITRIIPKNVILGSIVGIFLGFFIPACDCAVIPVSRRLIKKKVPLNVSVSFMLSSPIINPVVLFSTYVAFYSVNPKIFYFRLILGILIALIIGIIIGIIFRNKDVLLDKDEECKEHCHCHKENVDEEFLELEKYTVKNNCFKIKMLDVLKHAGEDFFDILKFLLMGAMIASIFQVAIPRSIIEIFNNNSVLSIIVLMIFAYVISLCSTSDSFVGKSLLSIFDSKGVLAYLLLGPMIDIKNTFVLFGNYKKSFVFTLILLIFICVFLFSLGVVVG